MSEFDFYADRRSSSGGDRLYQQAMRKLVAFANHEYRWADHGLQTTATAGAILENLAASFTSVDASKTSEHERYAAGDSGNTLYFDGAYKSMDRFLAIRDYFAPGFITENLIPDILAVEPKYETARATVVSIFTALRGIVSDCAGAASYRHDVLDTVRTLTALYLQGDLLELRLVTARNRGELDKEFSVIAADIRDKLMETGKDDPLVGHMLESALRNATGHHPTSQQLKEEGRKVGKDITQEMADFHQIAHIDRGSIQLDLTQRMQEEQTNAATLGRIGKALDTLVRQTGTLKDTKRGGPG